MLHQAIGSGDRLGRIVVGERARRAEERRRPSRVALERGLERLERLGLVVFLQEQFAPRRVDGGIARRGGRRGTVRAIRLLEPAERAQRTCRTCKAIGLRRPVAGHGDSLERGGGLGTTEHLLEQAELERGLAGRRTHRDGTQNRFSVRVAAAGNRRARLQRDDARIASIQFLGERVDFVVAAFDECAVAASSGDRDARRGAWAIRAPHTKNDNAGDQRRAAERTRWREMRPSTRGQVRASHHSSYYI